MIHLNPSPRRFHSSKFIEAKWSYGWYLCNNVFQNTASEWAIKNSEILDQTQDSEILDQTQHSEIKHPTQDSQIVHPTQYSEILDPSQNSNIGC